MEGGGRHGGGGGGGGSRAVVRLRDDPLEGLTDAERKCLRASRFAPLAPSLPQPSAGSAAAASSSCGGMRGQQPWAGGGGDKVHRSCPMSGPQPPPKAPRLAHPGGPLATNKAAALARFLRRKIQSGASHELDPRLVEKAVTNAQQILHAPTTRVKHVMSFDDDEDEARGNPSGNASTGGSAGGSEAARHAARSSMGAAKWPVSGGQKQVKKRDREDSNGRIQGKRRKNGRKEHFKPKHKNKGKNKKHCD